mmetsp:Transcript_24836/g.57461  ORF Transcript_24836/g.57461 Transcript_24836/m.57461 type:complete len:295 (+) Transcript_24836:3-887(+)
MLDEKAYHGRVELGNTMPAMGLGVVVAAGSNNKLKVGSKCLGLLGAQTVAKVTPGPEGPMAVAKLPGVPLSSSLGMLGLTTGFTAWMGIFRVAQKPKKGDVVVITAAAGAVGHIAAQLALTTGAKVIGVAGGPEKCDFLTKTLKLDGAIDYKSSTYSVGEQLDALAPDGVDFMLDQVGGEMLDDVLTRVRPNGRIVICGAISQYEGNLNHGKVRGPSEYLKLAERGATMKGYNVMQYFSSIPMAIISILWHWNRGNLTCHEHWESGIEEFPNSMEKMFSGGHIGRLLVKVGSEE